MAKVTYADKKDFVVNATVEEPNKITAGNMNELKRVINENEKASNIYASNGKTLQELLEKALYF